MSELQDLLAAPLAYRLGDRTYTISPLTLNDWAAYARCVQFHDYMSIKDDPLIPDELKAATLSECVKNQVTIHSYELAESLDTPWGMIEFCFLSLHKHHPDLTRETISTWHAKHVANIGGLAATISQLAIDDGDLSEEHKKKVAERICHLKTQGILA